MCRIVLWVVSVLRVLPAVPRYCCMNLLPEIIIPRMDLSSCVCDVCVCDVCVCVCDVYIYVFMFNIKSASVLFFYVFMFVIRSVIRSATSDCKSGSLMRW